MANSICIEKAKPSKIRRLGFLPRLGITIEVGGKQFTYRQAPIIETIVNVMDRGFSFKNLMDVAQEQLREIELPTLKSMKEKANNNQTDGEKTDL